MTALVDVQDLAKVFDVSAPWLNRVVERKPRQFVHAVDGVSFSIERGARSRSSANRVAQEHGGAFCSSACTGRRAARSGSTARPPMRRATRASCARCAGACR